jgi:zinc protease
VTAWPYSSFGPTGKVAEQKDVTDLDAVFVRFENGVRLTVKPTKFRDDQVVVKVRAGHGLLDMASDKQSRCGPARPSSRAVSSRSAPRTWSGC